MSAFIVSHDHIDAILTFAWNEGGLDVDALTRMGRKLLEENVRSVRHRYPEGELPGTIGETPESYAFKPFEGLPVLPAQKLAWVLKACHCYGYQACECDDYEQSEAYRIIQAIEERAVRSLPHYATAPWEINR